MEYNTDGFNERYTYIHNSLDDAKLKRTGPTNYDNSLAKMHIEENKPNIKTAEKELTNSNAEIKAKETDNRLLTNMNLNNVMKNNRLNNFK